MRGILRSILAAAVLTSGCPAMAQPAQLSPSLIDRHPGARLAARAGRLRYEFGLNAASTLHALPQAERLVLMQALGTTDPLSLNRWAQAIGPATQFIRLNGETASSVWWNPLIDAGLALRWRWASGAWRIEGAAPFTGEALRGAPASAGTSLGRSIRQLSAATRDSVRAGAAENLRRSDGSAAEILRRVRDADRSLRADGALPDIHPGRLIVAHRLLVRDQPGGRNAATLSAILDRLPGGARLMLAAHKRISEPDGEAVIWSSPGAPDTLFILRYPNDAPAISAPASIEPVALILAPGEEP